MKKLFTLLLIVLFFKVALQAQNNAPKIIETIPAFGDCQVDPQLNEIIVRFDQNMAKGRSLINTNRDPETAGESHWLNKRTFVIPVKLYPNKMYELQFNNNRFYNFRNTRNIPLNPDNLIFGTKSVDESALNQQAFQQFIEVFPKKYSYADFKGIDWQKELEQSRSVFENAKSSIEFALRLVNFLKMANDPHIRVNIEEQSYIPDQRRIISLNTGWRQLFEHLQNRYVGQRYATIAGTIDSVAYLSIRGWSSSFFEIPQKPWGSNNEITSQEMLSALFKYPNIIIDVRENGGGNETFARQFASWFTADTVAFEKVIGYSEESGQFDSEHIKKLYPNKNNICYSGNIYVLAGPAVMSSNESFVLMMKQLPNCKVVGMPTYGSSGNPLPYELANGVTVNIPSWQAFTLDGNLIEGNGVAPDVLVETKPEDFQKGDPVIDAVLKMINQ